MVNLEWYRTFKAVYETGSLTAAAKVLFITQPNVSQHISALEAHIGKTLFERRHRIIPTDYAKIIFAQIVGPIEKLEETEMIFKKMCLVKNRPTISIGAPKEYFHLLATENMKEFPAIIISTFGESKALLKKLLNGDVDFVLSTETDNNLQLKFEQILTEELWIVGSTAIDDSDFKKLIETGDLLAAENWLLKQNWLSYSSDLCDIKKFWVANFNKRPVLIPQAVIPDLQTILYGIAKGNGVTVASDMMTRQFIDEKKIKVIWKGEVAVKTVVSLVYEPKKAPTSILNIMKNIISKP